MVVMDTLGSPGLDASPSSPKSSNQSKREQKRRPKPKDGTILFCGVCGDRALGYNFDAISCESCKAFFRRNALKAKPFSCSFEGNCKLDPHTRKFCSGCRLKKCFTIGMKKEWILNEDQLVKRRQRQQTRQLQQKINSSTPDIQPCSSTSSDLLDDVVHPYPPRAHCSPSHSLHQHALASSTCHSSSDSNDYLPVAHSVYYDCHTSAAPSSSSSSSRKHHYSLSYQSSLSPSSTTSPTSHHAFPPLPLPGQSPFHHLGPDSAPKIPKVEHSSDEEENSCSGISRNQSAMHLHDVSSVGSGDDIVSCSVVKSENFEDSEDFTVPLNPNISKSLSELSKVYNEIFEAAYTQEQVPKLLSTPKTANQLFNMTDVFIRRLIRFAKHIPEFKSLAQSDQIHLLKGGIMEMFVLRSAMGFDSKSNSWRFKMQMSDTSNCPNSEGKVNSQVINALSTSMFMQHIQFVRQLQEVAKNDRTILMLLFIIELMSPDRPNLMDKRQVSQSQERHSMWLKAYLESIHTVAEARVIYPKLLVKLLDVRNLGEESFQLASHMDITNLEPLLVEVFDLHK